MKPGEYVLSDTPIICNNGRYTVTITVANTGDRPVQVGSHYHFFEVNRALRFDRDKAFGMRLNIPSGTAIRFEPGEEKEVTLVAVAGFRTIYGLNNLTEGTVSEERRKIQCLEKARQMGYYEEVTESGTDIK
jgi:urease beta subunit